jgi:hypothetical protein
MLFLSEANILIVQKVANQEKWADVLVNLKYKYFKAKIAEEGKMQINIFKQHKNLIIYFEKDGDMGRVFELINENKTAVLLRELSLFSDKLHYVRTLMERRASGGL